MSIFASDEDVQKKPSHTARCDFGPSNALLRCHEDIVAAAAAADMGVYYLSLARSEGGVDAMS